MSISTRRYQPAPTWHHQGERSQGQAVALDMTATIHAARSGDEDAFNKLVEFYYSAAERVAYRILRTEEAAADAVQDAWLKVHRAIPRFEDGNFRAWVLRIVTNTCYDYLRRRKRRPSVSLDELMEKTYTEVSTEEWGTDPVRSVLRQEQQGHILEAIHRLSPWHRDVVMLVDVQGYDYAQTAERLDVPLGTVKSRLSRARVNLRDDLVALNILPQAAQ